MWSLLSATFSDWYQDRAQRLGAALAYYTILAITPGLVIVMALAGLLLGPEAESRIMEQEKTAKPVTAEARAEQGLGPKPKK